MQAEEDYTSFGMGLEFVPADVPLRLSARGEYRDGDAPSTKLWSVAGDVAISRSLAVLSRQELLQTEQSQSIGPGLTRRIYSLWGLAFQPIKSDKLNVLTKFSWLDEGDEVCVTGRRIKELDAL